MGPVSKFKSAYFAILLLLFAALATALPVPVANSERDLQLIARDGGGGGRDWGSQRLARDGGGGGRDWNSHNGRRDGGGGGRDWNGTPNTPRDGGGGGRDWNGSPPA